MQSQRKRNAGFTLVEVLVAIFVLGLIVVAFVNVFGTTFVNIHTVGQRDAALAEASVLLDALYRAQEEHNGLSKTQIEAIVGQQGVVLERSPLNSEGISAGHKVVITVAYHGGERSISLESYIRSGGGE